MSNYNTNNNVPTSWIRRQIAERGPVTVAQYMEWALYHPEFGYYSRGPSIGPQGDFTTSPEASPAFGRLLAGHAAEIDAILGHPQVFSLIECGPGRGTLALQILDRLSESHPDLYRRLRYRLVEVSPGLTESQREALMPAHAPVASWARSLEQLPRGLAGALIANEVVDAFPAHVLENRDGTICEQYVDAGQSAGLTIVYQAPSRPELIAFLEKYGVALNPGQRVEINLLAGNWIGQVAQVMGRGVATVIDYGSTSPDRYSDARKEGTLLGYFGGAVTDDILARPGLQDLTALVDFTALMDAATSNTLEVIELTRQANFLLGLGLGTSVTFEVEEADLRATLENRRGIQALVSPEGLGRFRVLLLGKGVGSVQAKAGLSGLKYAE